MNERTRREAIHRLLEVSMDGVTPDELRQHLATQHDASVSQKQVLEEVDHVRQSLRNDSAELLVQPPACKDCGFDGFETLLGVPSQCPECRSEWIEQPAYTIEQ